MQSNNEITLLLDIHVGKNVMICNLWKWFRTSACYYSSFICCLIKMGSFDVGNAALKRLAVSAKQLFTAPPVAPVKRSSYILCKEIVNCRGDVHKVTSGYCDMYESISNAQAFNILNEMQADLHQAYSTLHFFHHYPPSLPSGFRNVSLCTKILAISSNNMHFLNSSLDLSKGGHEPKKSKAFSRSKLEL